MCPNHSTLIIYAIWLKFYILKILSRKKSSWDFNYNIMILICQTWIKFCKQFIYWKGNYEFTIKIIIDEAYYVKYYCWAWLWWKILYLFFFFFFFGFYIFVCCIPNYTMFVYLLQFKKIISFSYKKDLVSRCVCIDIKVDNFVYLWFEFILTE